MAKKQYKKGIITNEINEIDTNNQVIKMLINQRIDVALMNNFDLEKSIKEFSIDSAELKTFVVQEKPTALYLSKNFLETNSGFLDKFNASLEKCMEERD